MKFSLLGNDTSSWIAVHLFFSVFNTFYFFSFLANPCDRFNRSNPLRMMSFFWTPLDVNTLIGSIEDGFSTKRSYFIVQVISNGSKKEGRKPLQLSGQQRPLFCCSEFKYLGLLDFRMPDKTSWFGVNLLNQQYMVEVMVDNRSTWQPLHCSNDWTNNYNWGDRLKKKKKPQRNTFFESFAVSI